MTALVIMERIGVCEASSVGHGLFPVLGTRGHRYKLNDIYAVTETDVQKRASAICCVGPWNALPDEVVPEENICSIKRKLANVLGDTLFEHV